jgi:hypothetical protein
MSMPPEMMQAMMAAQQGGGQPTQPGQAPAQPGQIAEGQVGPQGEGKFAESAEGAMALLGQAMQVTSNKLYAEDTFDALVQMAKKTDPATALAEVTVRLITFAQEQIGQLPMEVLFGTAMAVVPDAADAIQQVGIEVDDKMVADALQMAIKKYLQANPKQFTTDELALGLKNLQEAVDQVDEKGQPISPEGAGMLKEDSK